MKRTLYVVAHNMRSTHNVGSLLRTAEGLGVKEVFLTGYTPYPQLKDDPRLPHIAQKLHKQIQKTALGAELSQTWSHHDSILDLLKQFNRANVAIVGLEQAPNAIPIVNFNPPGKLALILGSEVEGLESHILNLCSTTIEIPMAGKKESFNVVQAAAMALFYCRFYK